ncbi:MAG TPA: molybdopterin-dependent oxidoreductase [Actinomycetota bacterium]|nr:molybdopterin-dependent oxidoreductase [Actinomycetota bacterium]
MDDTRAEAAFEEDRPDPHALRIAGASGAAVALAVLWVISGFFESVPFPPSAIASRVLRSTPGDIATFFIELLAHWAMRLLGLGALLAAVVVGAEALRRVPGSGRARGVGAASILGLFAGTAALLAPGVDVSIPLICIAVLVAGVSYVVVARAALVGRAEAAPDEAPDTTRRAVLKMGVTGVAGVSLAGGIVGWFARRAGGPNTDVAIAMPGTSAVVPQRDDWPDIPGLTKEVTSAADHYIVDINLIQPSVEADEWSLEVIGQVATPLDLTFEELQSRFEVVEEYSVLSCISNEVGGNLVGHSLWGGVRLADVLDEAGVSLKSGDVVFRAADGYSDSIPLELARDPSTLIAIAQNREPLSQGHGFPCRVRIPSIYGMKNVKWLETIEVTKRNYVGYWQKRGWSDVAVVKTQSRIDVVAGADNVLKRGRPAWIAGVAWAGDRGISKVEVSTDRGETWSEARLRAPISRYSWHQWAYEWVPQSSGEVLVVARATDGTGELQEESETPPHPLGASGWHSVSAEVS